MYNTRSKAAASLDESKQMENKMVTKVTRATSHAQENRRNIAEVGHLAGAMSKGCTVKSETQERAFGTNLSNAHDSKKGLAEKAAPKAVRPAGLRTREVSQNLPAASGLGSTASNQAAPGRAKNVANRATRAATAAAKTAALQAAKEKEMSMTATLAARAEEATGGFDAEMIDAEEVKEVVLIMQKEFPDIDSQDKGDLLAVADYVADMYALYRKLEKQSIVSPDYMQKQNDINDKMRAILLDWLVEVHLKFKLMPETLFLTTNLIDRFLEVSPITRKNLQLVGVTAMLLASKYEEIWAPEVKDFVYISDNAYTKDQILDMEKLMLNTLKFNLSVPTPYVFTTRFLKAARADSQVQVVTWFFVELCLPEYSMLRFSPSHIAAAAVYTALLTVQKAPSWTYTLQRHTGLTETELKLCVSLMVGLHQKASTGSLTAVHKKYVGPKFQSVAILPPAILPADDSSSQC